MTQPLVIRPYDTADHAACRSLWVELTERHRLIYDDPTIGGDDPGSYLDTYLATPTRVESWVAVLDGEVVGLTGLFAEGNHGEVEPVVVTSRLRSQGVGRQLVEHVIAEAQQRGIAFLSIKPVARNIEAIALFHEIGFQNLGHLDLTMYLGSENREWKPGVDIHGRSYRY